MSDPKLVQLAAGAMDEFWVRRGGRRLTTAEAEVVVAALEPEIDARVAAGVAAWAKTARVDLDNLAVAADRLRDVLLDAETCGEPS